jgi:hypothetical protein
MSIAVEPPFRINRKNLYINKNDYIGRTGSSNDAKP